MRKIEIPSDLSDLFLAVFDFPKIESDDLEFLKDEILIGKHQIDNDWWLGCYLNDSLKSGIFPLTHVKRIEFKSIVSNDSPSKIEIIEAKVVVNFDGSDDSQQLLNLTVGDFVLVTEKIDTFWLKGENIEGKKGRFPRHCVELINENGRKNSILNRTQRNSLMNHESNSIDEASLISNYITELFRSINGESESSSDNFLISDENGLKNGDNRVDQEEMAFPSNDEMLYEEETASLTLESHSDIIKSENNTEANRLDNDYIHITQNNFKINSENKENLIDFQDQNDDVKQTSGVKSKPPPLPPKPSFLRVKNRNSMISDENPKSNCLIFFFKLFRNLL